MFLLSRIKNGRYEKYSINDNGVIGMEDVSFMKGVWNRVYFMVSWLRLKIIF